MPVAVLIIQALLQYGPEAARQIQAILSKETVAPEDWTSLWTLIETPGESYFQTVSGASVHAMKAELAMLRAKAGVTP